MFVMSSVGYVCDVCVVLVVLRTSTVGCRQLAVSIRYYRMVPFVLLPPVVRMASSHYDHQCQSTEQHIAHNALGGWFGFPLSLTNTKLHSDPPIPFLGLNLSKVTFQQTVHHAVVFHHCLALATLLYDHDDDDRISSSSIRSIYCLSKDLV